MDGGVCGFWWHLSASQVHRILLGRPELEAWVGGVACVVVLVASNL